MEKYEVIKFKDDEFEMDVNVSPNEETVWLTQNEISQLFDTTKQNVSLHINNIFKENELLRKATVKEILTVQNEGGRFISRKLNYYNLDMVLAIGYRVNSKRGVLFRKLANQVLKR